MRNSVKKMFSVLTLMFLLNGFTQVNALTYPTNEMFSTVENEITPMAPGDYNTYYTYTVVGSPFTLQRKFLNYHPLTPMWLYAYNYDISTSKAYDLSFNFTYESISVSGSFTLESGVTASVKADDNWESKLGLFGDIKMQKVLVKYYSSGVLQKQYYSYRTSLIPDTLSCRPVYR